jgi:hypothetical protein
MSADSPLAYRDRLRPPPGHRVSARRSAEVDVARLTSEEVQILLKSSRCSKDDQFFVKKGDGDLRPAVGDLSISRQSEHDRSQTMEAIYEWTQLGFALAKNSRRLAHLRWADVRLADRRRATYATQPDAEANGIPNWFEELEEGEE